MTAATALYELTRAIKAKDDAHAEASKALDQVIRAIKEGDRQGYGILDRMGEDYFVFLTINGSPGKLLVKWAHEVDLPEPTPVVEDLNPAVVEAFVEKLSDKY